MVATARSRNRSAPAVTGGSDLDPLPALSSPLAVGLGSGWAQKAMQALRTPLGTRRQSARLIALRWPLEAHSCLADEPCGDTARFGVRCRSASAPSLHEQWAGYDIERAELAAPIDAELG